MKHLKLYDSYISSEERNINDILDKMNKGDKSSEDDLSDLKNYGKNQEPTGYIEEDEREYQEISDRDYNLHFKRFLGKELTPEVLITILDKMRNKGINIRAFMRFFDEHTEIFDNIELDKIWFDFLLSDPFNYLIPPEE